MSEVRVHVDVSATPRAVWSVLSDIDGWSGWNEIMVHGRSRGGIGSPVSLKVDLGAIWFPVNSVLHTWEENRALAWGEDWGRIVRISHGFTLEPTDGGTRVVHYESFEGLIGRLVFPVIQRTLVRNYATFLDALKTRVEQ